eukprot:1152052-Pelagomonas_calceolata.AAC.10
MVLQGALNGDGTNASPVDGLAAAAGAAAGMVAPAVGLGRSLRSCETHDPPSGGPKYSRSCVDHAAQ